MPPPPAPLPPAFQACSVGGSPRASTSVPPTAVTYDWLAGSSTASASLPRQPSEPRSPAAASTDWPCAAASSKSDSSELTTEESESGSQTPQEVETTCALSWETMLL